MFAIISILFFGRVKVKITLIFRTKEYAIFYKKYKPDTDYDFMLLQFTGPKKAFGRCGRGE